MGWRRTQTNTDRCSATPKIFGMGRCFGARFDGSVFSFWPALFHYFYCVRGLWTRWAPTPPASKSTNPIQVPISSNFVKIQYPLFNRLFLLLLLLLCIFFILFGNFVRYRRTKWNKKKTSSKERIRIHSRQSIIQLRIAKDERKILRTPFPISKEFHSSD